MGVGLVAGIDGLLEDGDSGFAPEMFTEQDRRIRRGGEHRGGNRLCRVIQMREILGRDLKVYLEAGVAGLEHDGILPDSQLVGPLDHELKGAAAKVHQGLVQRGITRQRC